MPRPTPSPDLPPPNELGAPEKFVSWRPVQIAALFRHMNSGKRFVMSAMPTGSGKSLTYTMVAAMTGQRTVILTSTKGLQSQLLGDFAEMGVQDVRGMNAYACRGLAEGMFGAEQHESCDHGPCRFGAQCSLRMGGCLYFDAVRRAKEARIIVTNYAYWMMMQQYGQGLGEFVRLVLDEAHDAVNWLCSFLDAEITSRELAMVGVSLPDTDLDMPGWRKWAAAVSHQVEGRIEWLAEQWQQHPTGQISLSLRREGHMLKGLSSKLERFEAVGTDSIIEKLRGAVKLSVVWPARYAEKYLFRGIEHIDMVSATIRPKTAHLLGIKDADLDFADYPSDFPARNRMVIHVPTVRMSHRNDSDDERAWLSQVDSIIGERLDRKGIIHTVSYKRRDLLMENSKHRKVLISHTSATTRAVFDKFKTLEPPAVLVSPAATTGWDFPGDECEYQIVIKLPFPDLSSAVMKERVRTDKSYGAYICAQTLIQMVGRGMRFAGDQCETLVTDDNIRWFLRLYRGFFPQWFLEACTSVSVRAIPPKKMEKTI